MRYWFLVLVLAMAPGMCLAQQQPQTSEQRIAQLEARVAQLEKLIKPLLINHEMQSRLVMNKKKARARMRKDMKFYTREQIQSAEKTYQVANKNLKGPDTNAILQKVALDYPKANRAGCALLYLGQMSKGDEQLQYYKQAIKHGDCFYGNGVQVGAYARLMLAARLTQDGKKAEGLVVLDELAKLFPRSINHKGQPLELVTARLKNQLNAPAK